MSNPCASITHETHKILLLSNHQVDGVQESFCAGQDMLVAEGLMWHLHRT